MPLIVEKKKENQILQNKLSVLPIIFPTSGNNSTGDFSYVHNRDLNQAQLSLQIIS